jgi:hypothetical protein
VTPRIRGVTTVSAEEHDRDMAPAVLEGTLVSR